MFPSESGTKICKNDLRRPKCDSPSTGHRTLRSPINLQQERARDALSGRIDDPHVAIAGCVTHSTQPHASRCGAAQHPDMDMYEVDATTAHNNY